MENKTEQAIKIEIPRSDTDDIINGMFKIHLNEEVAELRKRLEKIEAGKKKRDGKSKNNKKK